MVGGEKMRTKYIRNNSTLRAFDWGTRLGRSEKRSYYTVFDYPQELEYNNFYSIYKRNAIANRIINAIPNSCWRDGVDIISNGEKVRMTQMDTLKKLGLFEKIEKADILNRIGKFSVLFIGVPDGQDAETPLGVINPAQIKDIYFQPYAENGIIISEYDEEPTSPRYGLPLIYSLSISTNSKSETVDFNSKRVHYSRVVHLAENSIDSEIEGHSSLEPIYNTILNLEKINGSSAESFYRNARGKYHFDIRDNFNGELSDAAKEQLKSDTQKFTDDYLDVMRTSGIDVEVLNTPIHSPKDTYDIEIQNISASTGIPIRVLTGVGSGQLAGSEDRASFNQLIQDRQKSFCTSVINDALKILVDCQAIEPFTLNEVVQFPLVDPLSEKEKAEITHQYADTILKLSQALNDSNGINGVIDEKEIIEKVGLTYTGDVYE